MAMGLKFSRVISHNVVKDAILDSIVLSILVNDLLYFLERTNIKMGEEQVEQSESSNVVTTEDSLHTVTKASENQLSSQQNSYVIRPNFSQK